MCTDTGSGECCGWGTRSEPRSASRGETKRLLRFPMLLRVLVASCRFVFVHHVLEKNGDI
jgi:hypothetical protein